MSIYRLPFVYAFGERSWIICVLHTIAAKIYGYCFHREYICAYFAIVFVNAYPFLYNFYICRLFIFKVCRLDIVMAIIICSTTICNIAVTIIYENGISNFFKLTGGIAPVALVHLKGTVLIILHIYPQIYLTGIKCQIVILRLTLFGILAKLIDKCSLGFPCLRLNQIARFNNSNQT